MTVLVFPAGQDKENRRSGAGKGSKKDRCVWKIESHMRASSHEGLKKKVRILQGFSGTGVTKGKGREIVQKDKETTEQSLKKKLMNSRGP